MTQVPESTPHPPAQSEARRSSGRLVITVLKVAAILFVSEFAVMYVLPMIGLKGVWENVANSIVLTLIALSALYALGSSPRRLIETDPPRRTRLERRMVILLVANVVMALLVICAYRLIVSGQTSGARMINVAGRQRMLSQRLVQFAMFESMDLAHVDMAEREPITSGSIAECSAQFEQALRGLVEGDAELGLIPCPSPDAGQQLEAVGAAWHQLRALLNRTSEPTDLDEEYAYYVALQRAGDRVLVEMDEAVELLEKHYEGRARLLSTVLGPTIVLAAVISFLLVVTIYRVTHHRQKLESDLRRLSSFPERNPHPILELRQDGRVSYCNPFGRDIIERLGLAAGEIDRLLPEGYHEHIEKCLREQREVGCPERELDGRTISWTFCPVQGTDLVHAYGRDITERKRAEEEREGLLHDMAERVKELRCLHGVADSIGKRDTLESIFRDVVALLPPGWHYPEITRVKIRFEGNDYVSEPFERTSWRQTSDIIVGGQRRGFVEVCYLEQRPDLDEGPFLKEERSLIDSIAHTLSETAERKRAEGETARFSRVLESSLNELYFFDPETLHFVNVNRGARENLGYSMEELRGLTPLDLKPEHTAESFEELIEPLRTGNQEKIRFITAHRRKDGSLYPVEVQLQLLGGSDPIFIGIILDITERKRAEAETQKRAEIEQERNSLRGAVKAQERLLGVVGHELRTPLAGIRAISELLIDEGSRDMEEFDVFLRNIHDEAVRMSGMVNDLLEVARMHSGAAQWNWSEVSLQDACEAAVSTVRPLIDQDKVELNIEVLPADLRMRGDVDGIRRLVLNLLNNACKNTSEGSIYVLATGSEHDGHAFVNLTVGDTGTGMTPEVARRLGQAFALNSGVVGDSHVKGSGLGLAICRGIATAHGGTISVKSAQGQGSMFTALLRADLEGPMSTEQETQIECEVT